MKEIGSEFSFGIISNSQSQAQPMVLTENQTLTYSGRTAIYAVLEDILSSFVIGTAWLPSYCCSSIIQPFIDFGISIKFYSVDYIKGEGIKRETFEPKCWDVVLTMGYFGFCDFGNHEIIDICKKRNVLVIEDRTHTLLSNFQQTSQAEYQVASLRKWFPLASGGLASKREGPLPRPTRKPRDDIIMLRLEAMHEKSEYLLNNMDNPYKKSQFLDKFRTCNEAFALDYKNTSMDTWSEKQLSEQNIYEVRQQRRNNAALLLHGLHEIPDITPLYSELQEGDCPLFVPIVINCRDTLQRYLASRRIYCPTHWARPSQTAESSLFEKELSLVCDQRYGQEDMKRIICEIKTFLKEAR